jgi:hypothetical protein
MCCVRRRELNPPLKVGPTFRSLCPLALHHPERMSDKVTMKTRFRHHDASGGVLVPGVYNDLEAEAYRFKLPRGELGSPRRQLPIRLPDERGGPSAQRREAGGLHLQALRT